MPKFFSRALLQWRPAPRKEGCVMHSTTQRTGRGYVASHWGALIVIAGAALFACTDGARTTTTGTTSTAPAAEIAAVAYLTPAQLLGVHRALAAAANEEASVAY